MEILVNLTTRLARQIVASRGSQVPAGFGLRLAIGATSLILASFTMLPPARAQACRDCPFPVKVDETHWLMPNRDVMLNLTEKQLNDGSILMRVSLSDVHTGEIFARGTAHRSPGQRNVSLHMHDPKGRRVKAKIRWINFEARVIQADFDCLENRTCTNLFGSAEPIGLQLSEPIGFHELHPVF